MMRSLYSGVSGLKTHQTKMDVIGNNIANVNTVGFKSSQVLFKDVLYQTTQRATGAAAEGSGGTNAKQIGLGTTTATITVSHKAGSAQSTNNPYDLMINGNSFFIVSREGMNYFTKVGAFGTDDAGNLVTGNGELVMGWQVDPDDPTQIRKDTVSALRPEAEENQTAEPEMTSKAYLSGGIAVTDPNLGTADGVPRTVSIYDNLGNAYTVKMTFRENATTEGAYNVSIVSIKDANNNDISGDYDYGFGAAQDKTVTVLFNKNTGSFEYVGSAGNNSATLQITSKNPTAQNGKGNVFQSVINGENVTGIEFDFSNLKMYSKTKECTYEIHRGSTEGEGGGRKVGKLTDVTIETSGMIYGVYDNGITKLLGQIAIANFVNPAGLEAIGNSLYKETNASGEFDGVGQSIDSVGETMTQGVVEMSNVDLSLEFTEMIVTQRGFQANSRIITVSDTLIEELVNLKR